MGMGKLPQITDIFQKLNRGNTPAAVIQNGTLENQKRGVGTINDIEEIVSQKRLSNPAIIIIGDVVSEASTINELSDKLELHLAS